MTSEPYDGQLRSVAMTEPQIAEAAEGLRIALRMSADALLRAATDAECNLDYDSALVDARGALDGCRRALGAHDALIPPPAEDGER